MTWKVPELLYSPEDLDLLLCRSWAPDVRGYLHSQMGRFHRIVAERMEGRKLTSKEQVDHINGVRLDNRRENLRVVDASKNQQNRQGPQRNGTSGHRGVTWDAAKKKWYAIGIVRGLRIARRFEDKEVAASFVTRLWQIAEDEQDARVIRERLFIEFPDGRKKSAACATP